MKKSYTVYLKSDHWLSKRREAFDHYGDGCNRCECQGTQIHHRTYTRLGRELMSDLEVLCGKCHEKHHEADIKKKKARKKAVSKKHNSKFSLSERRKNRLSCIFETHQDKQVACRQLAQWAGYKMKFLMDLESKELRKLMEKYAPKKYRKYLGLANKPSNLFNPI